MDNSAGFYRPDEIMVIRPDRNAYLRETYGLGELVSAFGGYVRTPALIATNLTDNQAALNQFSAIEMDYNGGVVAPYAQDVRVLAIRDLSQAANLVPAYGIHNDSPASVYENILTTGSLFEK